MYARAYWRTAGYAPAIIMHIAHFLNLYGADMRLISCRWVTNQNIMTEKIQSWHCKHIGLLTLHGNFHYSDQIYLLNMHDMSNRFLHINNKKIRYEGWWIEHVESRNQQNIFIFRARKFTCGCHSTLPSCIKKIITNHQPTKYTRDYVANGSRRQHLIV